MIINVNHHTHVPRFLSFSHNVCDTSIWNEYWSLLYVLLFQSFLYLFFYSRSIYLSILLVALSSLYLFLFSYFVMAPRPLVYIKQFTLVHFKEIISSAERTNERTNMLLHPLPKLHYARYPYTCYLPLVLVPRSKKRVCDVTVPEMIDGWQLSSTNITDWPVLYIWN